MSARFHVVIPEHVKAILERADITNFSLRLVDKLDPKVYKEVNKIIELAGGKWISRLGIHSFEGNPREALGMALAQGSILDVKKATQAFYTPELTARQVAQWVPQTAALILEPSAGHGALADAVAEHTGALVHCIESDSNSCRVLREKGYYTLQDDFLLQHPSRWAEYDAIIMNPPFTRNQDIQHVRHAYRFLAPGGVLMAITGTGWRNNSFAEAGNFRDWFGQRKGRIAETFPAGTFKSSGTMVETHLLTFTK